MIQLGDHLPSSTPRVSRRESKSFLNHFARNALFESLVPEYICTYQACAILLDLHFRNARDDAPKDLKLLTLLQSAKYRSRGSPRLLTSMHRRLGIV